MTTRRASAEKSNQRTKAAKKSAAASSHSFGPPSGARKAFEDGHHREVVETVRYPRCSNEEAMALIGSLSFLGRLEEAKVLWTLAHPKLNGPERARARFAMALAFTRVSRFKAARRWLKENLTDPETKTRAESHQGLAIYHYYLGRFERAAANARVALRASMEIGDDYIRAFATDLYGHSLLQTRRRSAGLRLLAEARELSKKKNSSDPYTPARLVYEAEAGLRADSIVEELKTLLSSTLPEDTHTRSNLVLELARQLTLRGAWLEARLLLDAESHTIYSFENRRHEATLQLRLAEIAYRQGDAPGATHFLQAARRCLNKIADVVYEIRIMGLEHKIERRLLSREPSAESTARLALLSKSHASPVNTRIQARANGAAHLHLQADSVDEDPLGDLLDRVSTSPEGAEDLLRAGYLGLWPEAYGLKPGGEHLILRESGEWLAAAKDGVERSKAPLSSLSRKVLNCISGETASKEKLIKVVWGYEYDPLRHDSMIYAALAALRKSLRGAARWILSHDEGWSLANGQGPGSSTNFSFIDESVREEKRRQASAKMAPTAEVPATVSRDDALNWRQVRALREMGRAETSRAVWTVPDYKEVFKVSTMTAWRDLDGLMKTGYFSRIGRGRATVYVKEQV